VRYGGRTLSAIAGVNGKLLTRDVQPHGTVADATSSPLLSIGYYEDWRLGMEQVGWLGVIPVRYAVYPWIATVTQG
jgi:hypothetical protein